MPDAEKPSAAELRPTRTEHTTATTSVWQLDTLPDVMGKIKPIGEECEELIGHFH